MVNQHTAHVHCRHIPLRHPLYPRKLDNPKHVACLSGTAHFVWLDSQFVGRIWRTSWKSRTKGGWTWARHNLVDGGAFGPMIAQGVADSKVKALAALVAAARTADSVTTAA